MIKPHPEKPRKEGLGKVGALQPRFHELERVEHGRGVRPGDEAARRVGPGLQLASRLLAAHCQRA